MNLEGKRIVISRTDSIGDVMLTLPVCHWIKQQAPSAQIVFLGKGYTRPVVEAYQEVDQFEDWGTVEKLEEKAQLAWLKSLNAAVFIHVFPNKALAALAKKANIPVRIGTSHRLYHLWTCSHRVRFTRRNSELHEAQLNFELLRPLGLESIPELSALVMTTQAFHPKKEALPAPYDSLENYVILHPKSQGSAREWPMEKYRELAEKMVAENANVVFTGTEKEGEMFRSELPENAHIFDSTGQLSLNQLMLLIEKSNGLIACSTGPLHIAGFLGVRTVGLFSPKRPIHPGRWKALGPQVTILVNDDCMACAKGEECHCMENISVEAAFEALHKNP